jgi:hypothetical protein
VFRLHQTRLAFQLHQSEIGAVHDLVFRIWVTHDPLHRPRHSDRRPNAGAKDMSITTTLADIRAADPCSDGFAKIRDHLGVSPADAKENHEPFPVALLLETNDLGDTLWVLDNVIGNKRLCRLFAADCAESVLPIFERHRPDDDRPRHAISVGRDPNSTDAARAAAGDAARAASCAAEVAAGAAWAAGAAAGAAAGDAARAAGDAAWAAGAAAGAAAGDAARAAAWAAGDAARAEAITTRVGAWAAWDAAWDAARDAAWDAYIARLCQYLEHGEAAADMPWSAALVPA